MKKKNHIVLLFRIKTSFLPPQWRGALYQSHERTCSGNDAELIAFNPDAADNLEASALRQRRGKSMQEIREEQKKTRKHTRKVK